MNIDELLIFEQTRTLILLTAVKVRAAIMNQVSYSSKQITSLRNRVIRVKDRKILEKITLMFFGFILLIIQISSDASFPLSIAGFPLVIIQMRKIMINYVEIRKIKKLRNILDNPRSRENRAALDEIIGRHSNQQLQINIDVRMITEKKEFIENIGYLTFLILIFLCYEKDLNLTPCCIVGVFSFVQRFLWLKYLKSEYDNYYKICILILKALINMAIFNFFLRFDEKIDWKWEAIFWPLYIICSLSLIFSVSSALICAGSILASVLSIIKFIKILNVKEGENEPMKYQLGLFPSAYLFGLIILTILNFGYLQQWLIDNVFKQKSLLSQQIRDPNNRIRNEIEEQIQETPRYLMLISGSYFKTLKQYSIDMYRQIKKITNKGSKTIQVQPESPNLQQKSLDPKKKQKQTTIFEKFGISNQVKIMSIKQTKMKLDKKKINKNKTKTERLRSTKDIFLDDNVCFSEIDEMQQNRLIQQQRQQRARPYLNDERILNQVSFDTRDQTLVTTLDKHQLLDTIKQTIDYKQQFKNINKNNLNSRQDLFNTLGAQKQYLVMDKKSIYIDTYKKFKDDPDAFKSVFKRRLSATEFTHHPPNIKEQMIKAKQELRKKLQGQNSATKDGKNTQSGVCDKQEELKKECVICLSGVADAVIMNCGHGGLCFDCGQKLTMSKQEQRCHLCRKKIKLILKIDLNRISGQFVPILYYLDLRGNLPEIKQIKRKDNKKPVIDLESVQFTINDEILSDDSRIHIHQFQSLDLSNAFENTQVRNLLNRSNSFEMQQRYYDEELQMPRGDAIDDIQLRTIESIDDQLNMTNINIINNMQTLVANSNTNR
ncbi:zinc finger domain protein [Stylonychia lemnae]|uniref:Zinc finger domain protein n=1 Tax=Stylonychia lemnae TaxID=5949 RepID=A0A077ZXR4_STYLE|nr:zinc finger domain protein [Stylonychia lemnae]|eukprot:CDW74700.1 zinc finger domain protein [Stylonychia lemnae]